MKSDTMIDINNEHTLRSQYNCDRAISDDNGSFLGKILTVIASIIIVFSVYIMMPNLIKHFDKITPLAEVEESTSQKKPSLKHLDAYLWTSKLKLEDLKLNHRLVISLSDESSLKINGSISKQELANWQNFQNWYESKEGFPRLIKAVSVTAISGNIPELNSVWFDANPTAYFADGRSGTIGTVFDDGWKIVSIETWAVFVERNGTTITLNY